MTRNFVIGEHISRSVYMIVVCESIFHHVFMRILHIITVHNFIPEDNETKNNSNLGLLGFFLLKAQVEHGAVKTDHSDGVSQSNVGCVQ